MDWTTGQKLQNGQYIIEQELGRGRFGITYLAQDRQGKELVIETLNQDHLNHLTPRDRDSLKCQFVDQARKLESCHHPHLVGVYKTFIEGQLFCLAMEYIRGNTLAQLAHIGLSEAEALAYIQQVGEALIELHNQGLWHQNVKPANIVVQPERNQAVLIAVDLAAEFDHLLASRRRDQPFVPLELNCSQMPRGACTDVYSLAATLYVLLTGNLPASAVARQDGKADLIPPKMINPQISRRVNDAIIKGMRLEPDARPQTMQEWLNLLGLKRRISVPKRKPNPVIVWTVLGTIAGLLATIIALLGYIKSPWHFPPETPPSVTSPLDVEPKPIKEQ